MAEYKYTETESDWDAPHVEGEETPKRKPTLRVEVGSTQLKQAAIGENFTIKITGKVKSLESSDRRSTIELIMESSEVEDTRTKDSIAGMLNA